MMNMIYKIKKLILIKNFLLIILSMLKNFKFYGAQ